MIIPEFHVRRQSSGSNIAFTLMFVITALQLVL